MVDQDYVLRVPDNLDLAGAAPLLCAGITVFSPFMHWGISARHRVGVLGLGGLGMCTNPNIHHSCKKHREGTEGKTLDDNIRHHVLCVVGHMAVKILVAMGCEVVVLSTSPSKKSLAQELGAHHFLVTSDAAQLAANANSLDFIIDTGTNLLEQNGRTRGGRRRWISLDMSDVRPKGVEDISFGGLTHGG